MWLIDIQTDIQTELQTDIHAYIHTNLVINRGAPLLKMIFIFINISKFKVKYINAYTGFRDESSQDPSSKIKVFRF